MTVYYLGHALTLESQTPDGRGYVPCLWPNGKRYWHWPAQLRLLKDPLA